MSFQVFGSPSIRNPRRSPRAASMTWQRTLLLGLAAWLSGSLVLDVIVMPSLYAAGMIRQVEFSSAGYVLFWVFNRIELVFAALVLSGVLGLYSLMRPTGRGAKVAIALAVFLFSIPLIYTYALTPSMSALGLDLTPFSMGDGLSSAMVRLHRDYFGLEAIKLGVGAVLLGLCYRMGAPSSVSNS